MAYYNSGTPAKERAVEAARIMSNFVNDMCRDEECFLEAMSREHRTLQQAFSGLCFAWIKLNAEKLGKQDFDLRNEYTVEKCVEIVEKVELYNPPTI